MNSEAIFHVSKVSKIFGDDIETQVRALDKVDLKIHKGDFAALVGPSGSGKSTLLNIMSGLDDPSEGDVYLNGKDISELSGNVLADFRRDHIGFIFQAYNLIPVLTAEENIEYVMQLQGVSAAERKKKVQEVLKDVGLEGKEKRFPNQLSGGQQQRVAVARAIVSRPEIILADEPTANLDSKTGTNLVELMKELNEKYQITFIFSTHDPIIMERAKRLIRLKDGAIESDEKK
ncbi:ABC transporter ATP-binding protein [Bacteriovoracaceae bacterium]|nr:ABC transporter ATP-binding protein [Bacteriovoracaceae bacterium]